MHHHSGRCVCRSVQTPEVRVLTFDGLDELVSDVSDLEEGVRVILVVFLQGKGGDGRMRGGSERQDQNFGTYFKVEDTA